MVALTHRLDFVIGEKAARQLDDVDPIPQLLQQPPGTPINYSIPGNNGGPSPPVTVTVTSGPSGPTPIVYWIGGSGRGVQKCSGLNP